MSLMFADRHISRSTPMKGANPLKPSKIPFRHKNPQAWCKCGAYFVRSPRYLWFPIAPSYLAWCVKSPIFADQMW